MGLLNRGVFYSIRPLEGKGEKVGDWESRKAKRETNQIRSLFELRPFARFQKLHLPIGSASDEEPGSLPGEGPRVTIGQEIAPGLLARFSRQFGPEPYDEATLEYYLSKILRLRATFSDAQTVTSRSPFRRVERARLDLLFFFSF